MPRAQQLLNECASLNAGDSALSGMMSMEPGPRTQGRLIMSKAWAMGLCEALVGLCLENQSSIYQGGRAHIQVQSQGQLHEKSMAETGGLWCNGSRGWIVEGERQHSNRMVKSKDSAAHSTFVGMLPLLHYNLGQVTYLLRVFIWKVSLSEKWQQYSSLRWVILKMN